MKSIQEYTILWNATESGTFIIQVMRQRERNNVQSCTPYSDDDMRLNYFETIKLPMIFPNFCHLYQGIRRFTKFD
ncbi:CLUMA_CG017715, isoform A [Clunio marinus]|uniref:CLUMA_CG017715, isoform A n=1 Tax=Clunio marinus TaxID=568069 RepID=A0A1J1IWI9_9DIPT|nr:CLUMA_CG017715, isoform A [Clunio marinus]